MPELRRRWQGKSQEEMKNYTNSQIAALIDEHIHSARDRDILKMRFIDGFTYSVISDRIFEKHKVPISPRQISSIISRDMAKLSTYL